MSTTTARSAERYLGVHDLAERWGERRITVYSRIRTPERLDAVRTIQLGRKLLLLEADVHAFEEAHRITPETIAAALGEALPAEPLGQQPAEPDGAPATEFGPRRTLLRGKAAARWPGTRSARSPTRRSAATSAASCTARPRASHASGSSVLQDAR